MSDQRPDPAREDELVETLSAYLDGELDARASAAVERLVLGDIVAARQLALLRSARDAVAASAPDLLPEPAERDRIDAAVLEATTAGATIAAEPAPDRVVSPLRPRRPSPRRRGRRPLPYFAAAALIAIVLSAGLALLVPRLGTQSDNSNTVSAPAEKATTTTPGVESAADSGASGAAAGTDSSPAAPALSSESPALFVAPVDASTSADLAALLAAAPTVGADLPAARAAIEATASGVGDAPGLEGLGVCLDAAPLIVSRVDTGTWQGAPAFFLSGATAAGPASQVVVLARPGCQVLTTYP